MPGHQPHEVLQDLHPSGCHGTNDRDQDPFLSSPTARTVHGLQGRAFPDVGLQLLRSEPSNRTTIHTLLCLSVWFTDQRTIKNPFFASNPMVKHIGKPTRPTNHVPPKSGAETVEVCKPTPTDSGGTSSADTGDVTKVMPPESLAEGMKEHSHSPSLSLLSNDNTRERMSSACQSSSETVADNRHYPTSSNLQSDGMREENKQPTVVEEPQPLSCHQDESLLQEVSTEGKGTEA